MSAFKHWFHNPSITCVMFLYAIVVAFSGLSGSARAESSSDKVVIQKDLIRVEAPAGYKRYAESVLAHATAALRILNSRTNDALLVPITFVVAADEKTFLEMAGGEGEQSLAVAIGEKRLVVISRPAMAKSASDRIQQVLVHELAHVYLDVKCNAFVPRWLHEGIAQQVAGEWPDAPGEAHLAIAAYTGGLIPLKELVVTFPRDIAGRNQAYAEALSATRFLIREDHGNSLSHLLAAIRGDAGRNYLHSLGLTMFLNTLNSRWESDLRSPLSAVTILLGNGFFWGVAAILVVVAFVLKRRRSKVIRQQWAEEEAVWVDGDEAANVGYADTDDPDMLYMEGDGEEWKRGDGDY